jgi:hypothetical protein
VGGQDIFYAAGYGVEGKIFVLEKQADESLVLVDTIEIGVLLLSSCEEAADRRNARWVSRQSDGITGRHSVRRR